MCIGTAQEMFLFERSKVLLSVLNDVLDKNIESFDWCEQNTSVNALGRLKYRFVMKEKEGLDDISQHNVNKSKYL